MESETPVTVNGREIGYVEPQTWQGNEQFAARLTVRGDEFVGLYNHLDTAADAVRDAYRAL